jgi:hypothetical protein
MRYTLTIQVDVEAEDMDHLDDLTREIEESIEDQFVFEVISADTVSIS